MTGKKKLLMRIEIGTHQMSRVWEVIIFFVVHMTLFNEQRQSQSSSFKQLLWTPNLACPYCTCMYDLECTDKMKLLSFIH